MPEGIHVMKGAQPIRKRGANYNSGGSNSYPIANGYATSIGEGDLVKLVNGVIQLAANGDKVLGVFQQCMHINAGGQLVNRNFYAGGTTSKVGAYVAGGYQQPLAAVYDDPNQMYSMRTGDAQTVVQANIGKSFPLTGQGTLLNGRSQATIDMATVGTTGNMAVTIVDVYRDTASGFGVTPAAVEVKLANPGMVDNVSPTA